MIRRLGVLASFVLVITIAVPRAAAAQAPVDANGWLVSPLLALTFDDDAHASLAVAGALDYVLTSAIAVEGELGHVLDMAPNDSNVDSSLTTLHGSLLYFLGTAKSVHPYLAAGLGIGKFTREIERPPASIKSTEMGFNIGGGVTYALSDRAWVRGDVRFFNHIDETPSVWRFAGGILLRVGP